MWFFQSLKKKCDNFFIKTVKPVCHFSSNSTYIPWSFRPTVKMAINAAWQLPENPSRFSLLLEWRCRKTDPSPKPWMNSISHIWFSFYYSSFEYFYLLLCIGRIQAQIESGLMAYFYSKATVRVANCLIIRLELSIKLSITCMLYIASSGSMEDGKSKCLCSSNVIDSIGNVTCFRYFRPWRQSVNSRFSTGTHLQADSKSLL